MSKDYGKAFEERFKWDWLKSFPNSDLTRLYDQVSGYKNISNVSDFVCYNYPNLFYIECKSHSGASIPFDKISQYDKMVKKVGIPGVRAGVVLWLYEKDRVFYVPISTITELKKKGEKSVGLRHLNNYNIKEISSVKLRTFMKSDYSSLMELEDGE